MKKKKAKRKSTKKRGIEKKRRQHYVWQEYLSAWTRGEELYCRREGKVFHTGTVNVAQERDFYRLRPLSEEEERFLMLLLGGDSPEVRRAMTIHTEAYLAPLKQLAEIRALRRQMEARCGGRLPEELRQKIEELEADTDALVNNVDEDFYAEMEQEALPWLTALRRRRADFYTCPEDRGSEEGYYGDESFQFLLFVCMQYFRTKAVKERWIAAVGGSLKGPELRSMGFSPEKIDLENLFPHFIWAVQNRTAFFLRQSRAPLTLLRNDTAVPFVTSDQPVINLKADYQNLREETREMVFYYPVSPDTAILLNGGRQAEVQLTEEEVDSYNRALIRASYQMVIADGEEHIMRYALA